MNGRGFCLQSKTLPTGITVCAAPLTPTAGKRCYTPTKSTFNLTSCGSNPDSLAWLLLVTTVCTFICSAILPRKQQQLSASWFIPPPYVQLSVCMTIKNKATHIMALKHVTNQLHPLSHHNIQNAWLPWCGEGQTQPDHTGD